MRKREREAADHSSIYVVVYGSTSSPSSRDKPTESRKKEERRNNAQRVFSCPRGDKRR